jgi:hypothetical protein
MPSTSISNGNTGSITHKQPAFSGQLSVDTMNKGLVADSLKEGQDERET